MELEVSDIIVASVSQDRLLSKLRLHDNYTVMDHSMSHPYVSRETFVRSFRYFTDRYYITRNTAIARVS